MDRFPVAGSGRAPPALTAATELGLAVLAAVLFAAAVAVAAVEGLDARLLLALRDGDDPARALGPLWLREALRDVTALGSNVLLGVVTLAAVVWLALLGALRRGAALAGSVAAALLVVNLLKHFMGRGRPDLLDELPVFSASFPSSHAMLSAAVFLTLGLLAAEAAPRALGQAILLFALGLSAAAGLSRLYLGLHWPSDVLGGWALGILWALLAVRSLRALGRAGVIEPGAGRSAGAGS